MYWQGLHTIAYYANLFYQEKLARMAQPADVGASFRSAGPPAAQQPVTSTSQASRAPADPGALERMLENLIQTGKLDPTMLQQLLALNDEAAIDRILAKLKELGADEGPSPPLDIANHYRPGPGQYQLKWPLSRTLPLPLPFDQLDRKTQFYVLFNEWSRRELEGYQALEAGDTAGAQRIFEECLARTEQVDVPELKARSYEGLMRVAQKLYDREAERRWLDAALAVREQG